MNSATAPEQPIASVEAHDAAVDQILLQECGTIVVRFRHIAVYHGTGVPYAIWSYRARLEISRAASVDMSWWSYEHEDYVSDGFFVADGAEDREWAALLGDRAVQRIHILFGSGRSLTAESAHAQIFPEEPLEHFDDWNEPLADFAPKPDNRE